MKKINQRNKISKGWQKVKLREVVEINPSIRLKRERSYPYLDMADVQPSSIIREIRKRKVFKGGGARFEKGDTLFARITPCLEHKKITWIKSINGPGFGSTEFFVLRGKNKITDNKFVYYLSLSHKVRKMAEQSMIGASGRQRVERAAFENIEVKLPEDINEQKRIANILSAFDEKIELNNKINQTLEEMAQAIFKEWILKNQKSPKDPPPKFGGGPTGQAKIKNQKLGDLADIKYGQGPASSKLKKSGYPVYGANGVIGYFDSYNFSDRQIIVGCRGVVGNVTLTLPQCVVTHNSLVITPRSNRKIFFYYLLKNQNLDAVVGGSAQPQITIRDLEQFELPMPEEELQNDFESVVGSLEQKRLMNFYENQKLAALRDLLLPKLMSGEILVKSEE